MPLIYEAKWDASLGSLQSSDDDEELASNLCEMNGLGHLSEWNVLAMLRRYYPEEKPANYEEYRSYYEGQLLTDEVSAWKTALAGCPH